MNLRKQRQHLFHRKLYKHTRGQDPPPPDIFLKFSKKEDEKTSKLVSSQCNVKPILHLCGKIRRSQQKLLTAPSHTDCAQNHPLRSRKITLGRLRASDPRRRRYLPLARLPAANAISRVPTEPPPCGPGWRGFAGSRCRCGCPCRRLIDPEVRLRAHIYPCFGEGIWLGRGTIHILRGNPVHAVRQSQHLSGRNALPVPVSIFRLSTKYVGERPSLIPKYGVQRKDRVRHISTAGSSVCF